MFKCKLINVLNFGQKLLNCETIHHQMRNLRGRQYFTSILYCSKFTIRYYNIEYIANFLVQPILEKTHFYVE